MDPITVGVLIASSVLPGLISALRRQPMVAVRLLIWSLWTVILPVLTLPILSVLFRLPQELALGHGELAALAIGVTAGALDMASTVLVMKRPKFTWAAGLVI